MPNAVLDARTTDSTARTALSAEFDFRVPYRVRHGECIRAVARIKNTGAATWLPESARSDGHGVVRIGGRILDTSGYPRKDFFRQPVSVDRPIAPGEELELPVEIWAHERGVWNVQFDLVAEGVGWFGDNGCTVSKQTFEVI